MEAIYKKAILLIYSLFIVAMSVLPVSGPQKLEHLGADKVVHFSFYIIFALLYVYAFAYDRFVYVKSFVCGFSLGVSIEILQYFIPYRSFEVLDIIADGLGAAAGMIIAYKLGKSGESN